MDKLLLVSAVVSSALGASAHSSLALSAADLAAPVHDVAAVEAHNAGEATWTAALQPKFEGWTMGEAVHLMGTFLNFEDADLAAEEEASISVGAIPDNFDVETNWPNCVMPVQDQGHCGSCWAFGTTEALASRKCIAAGGNDTSVDVQLSAQNLVSCAPAPNAGCNGGIPTLAWKHTVRHPVMTEACYPYTSGTTQKNGQCSKVCTADGHSSDPTVNAKMFSTKTFSSPAAMQSALMTDGAITGTFKVYKSFLAYESGVYARGDDTQILGGHAILITGWGVQKNDDGTTTNYWRCKNSWANTWGEDGYFRIIRGDNSQSGGMDSGSCAGIPK